MREQVLVLWPLVLGLLSSSLPVQAQWVGFGKALLSRAVWRPIHCRGLNLAQEGISPLIPTPLPLFWALGT